MYSEHLTSAVGPEQYVRLAHATTFYEKFGFKYTDAPWFVQQKVDHATKPPFVKPIHHHVAALNHTFHFAASGEQSFLQMQYESMKNRYEYIKGCWQTITPCFRDEVKITDSKRLGFMKLELIEWDNPNVNKLNEITLAALRFFRQHIACRVIDNDQEDEQGRDIISDKLSIELGSYGIRHNVIGGIPMSWIYATGLAEPRLSWAIEQEKKA